MRRQLSRQRTNSGAYSSAPNVCNVVDVRRLLDCTSTYEKENNNKWLLFQIILLEKCEGIPGGPGGGQKPKLFGYNVVFEPGATQNDVVEYSGIKRIIEMAIEGFSCTAFCYGQTGSGKTHTLTGPPDLVITRFNYNWPNSRMLAFDTLLHLRPTAKRSPICALLFQFIGKPEPNDSRHGLVFRAFLYLFQLLQERKDTNFVLKASFLEIYNEKVCDANCFLLPVSTHTRLWLARLISCLLNWWSFGGVASGSCDISVQLQ